MLIGRRRPDFMNILMLKGCFKCLVYMYVHIHVLTQACIDIHAFIHTYMHTDDHTCSNMH